ncbi:MAG: alpha/beta hydrolase [Acidimicrobiales bacterium]|nr:alpha/beta hydrolase [Acidimicrobiales bacterium]
MPLAPYSSVEVPVEGGTLHVGRWGHGDQVVVAAHGITGNHRSWQAVARALEPGVTLVASDLRGRGRSTDLPGPFGMRRHAQDMVAVLDHLHLDQAVLAGHSMGAYVAAVAATTDPKRWSSVVLVDGGVALPLPRAVDPDDMLAGVLGPALARLEMVFADRAAYHAFWRDHPALVEPGAWNEDTEAWLDHDLTGEEPELHSSASLEAVRFDGRELLVDEQVRRACFDLQQPTTLLRAPRGLLNQVPPLLPDELLDPLRARWPIRMEMLVENTNHYSILLAPRGARAVATHLAGACRRLAG